jgi:hypothetical protein
MLPHLPAADKSARAVRRPKMSAAKLTEKTNCRKSPPANLTHNKSQKSLVA